ncbi:MAG: cryptochrome/photolyase family protein [Alphaproteobacteria bacterium]
MTQKTALIWFRQDLRLHDNPALHHAVENEYKIIPLFILDDENAGPWKRGGASRWWLHQSLQSLNNSLEGNLVFRKGKADEIIPELVKEHEIKAVFWNRCYEPWRISRDQNIKTQLKESRIECDTFNGSLLWEPWEIKKDDGTPYKVFTPFYKKGCLNAAPPLEPLPKPDNISFADFRPRYDVSDLDLLPAIQWYRKMKPHWEISESGAHERLHHFLENGLSGYKEDRNRPDKDNTSMLSPYLHHGEISVREIWHQARAKGMDCAPEKDVEHFCSELGWREFSHSLLYYNPEITDKPIQAKFEAFPWDKNDAYLERWQKGQTGIPIVDAGMRQLWQTGWMHNRVRMIVGSFLIKNMLIHWQEGHKWFWDCLVDADYANNGASWQWVAGCGADAAPYFRIFNPVTQGEKFDPDGAYIRQYVPELKELPTKYLYAPWEAPPLVLKEAGITLGKDYPEAVVDLKASRNRALEAFQSLK